MKTLTTLLICLYACVVSGQTKPEFNINGQSVITFSNDKTMFYFQILKGKPTMTAELDSDVIEIDLNNGNPVAKAPYRVEMHRKIMWIFKNGKYIGAFGYYKKPIEIKDLKSS